MVATKPAPSTDITAELATRAATAPDYLSEKLNLQDLAGQMAEHPEQVLPRLVSLALTACECSSAGISLFESENDLFRWHHLAGVLATFNGATTPRNFSPCGVCLDTREPILMKNPERVYGWIADANIVVPEVLLVPLFVGGAEPLGTLWIVSHEEQHFNSSHARAMTELAGFAGIALRMIRTEEKLRQSLENQETLTKEMSHRVKNVFAIADGMIKLSSRSAETPKELADSLSLRFHALANAHSLVRRSMTDTAPHRKVDVAALLEAILRPHDIDALSLKGPEVALGESATNGLALVFHELATNAAKYGALSAGGKVAVSWLTHDDNLAFTWQETGGPRIERPPTRTGFGTALSERTVVKQFGGTISYDWKPEGLTVAISVPMNQLSR